MNAIDPYILQGAAALLALVIGVLIGRAGRASRHRVLQLEAELAERNEQLEALAASRAELEAHREELGLRLIAAEQESTERREALSRYQSQVVGHFNQTSDLLKEMTLQYRNIYQHLAEGAETLCPEGVPRLEKDTPIDGLPGGGDAGPARAAASGEADDPRTEPGGEPGERGDEEAEDSVSAAHRDAPLQVDPRPEA